jgi:MHS family proline/betaine transporter-like MFS transporter
MTDVSGTKQSTLRTALAGLIGNVLEWFDFAVYGYFASNIGHQFFPKSDPAVQTFLAYATFALGFFARPIGSIVLGRVGDRIGRKALLTLSIRADGRRNAGARTPADVRPGRHSRADSADVDASAPGHLARR